jgi:hypothetical protein
MLAAVSHQPSARRGGRSAGSRQSWQGPSVSHPCPICVHPNAGKPECGLTRMRVNPNAGSSADSPSDVVSYQRSAVSYQLSAFSGQLSAVSYQPSAISRQRSAVSRQPPAISRQSWQGSSVSHPLSYLRSRAFGFICVHRRFHPCPPECGLTRMRVNPNAGKPECGLARCGDRIALRGLRGERGQAPILRFL